MQTSKIHVLAVDGINSFDEVEGSARGLAFKYGTRLSGSGMAMSKVTLRMLRKKSGNLDNANEQNIMDYIAETIVQDAAPVEDGESIGIYVVGHYTNLIGCLGFLHPKSLACYIGSLIAREDKGNKGALRKICLVACDAASEEMFDMDNSRELCAQAKSYVQKLCVQLHALDMHPMVAGWDRFISVVYPGMQMAVDLTHNKESFEQGKLQWPSSMQQSSSLPSEVTGKEGKGEKEEIPGASFIGRKFVTPSRSVSAAKSTNVLVKNRSGIYKNKLVFVYDSEKNAIVPKSEGWSDKK
jgi:hypothetical protein